MRFPHWLKTLAGALLLSAHAASVEAQGSGAPGGGQPMFQPAYGANDPGVLYPQGVPQGYQPYPAISPYNMGNIAWDQTYRDSNGLWFRRLMNTDREFFGYFDATYNITKDPGDKELGSPHIPFDPVSRTLLGYNIPTYGQGGTPGTVAGGGAAATIGLPASRVIVDQRVIPFPIGGLVPFFVTVQINKDIFPIRGLNEFKSYRSPGLQGGFGFFNEDGTGMSANGFWTGDANQSFTMGTASINGIPINQDIIDQSAGSLIFMRNGAIPLDWGFSSSDLFPGITGNLGTTKYDILFHMDTKTSAWGTDLNYYMLPIVNKNAIKLRPMIGGRYLSVDDQFRFQGIDSGFDYNFLIVTGNAGGGGGGRTVNTYRPVPNSQIRIYDLYQATLSSSVRSNLAGPQVGLRYDFGEGDHFKIWGQSIVGLMANQENYHLQGNNIGDQAGLLLFGNGLDMLSSDARFNSTRTITHVSPLFEQTIMAEMNILDRIPIIKRMPGVENTMFRIGYTATVVGQVARSGESIDWKGFPNFPSIHPGRETWWNHRFNIGIEKRF